MKNKKICMVTYFDRGFEKMGNLCLESMKKYASRYNFDISLHNEITSDRPFPWNKILVLQKLLKQGKYDYFLWIDSDAIFVRFEEDIRKQIKKDKDFYLVKHNINNSEIPNTGVMLVKNTKWSREFLKQMWNKKEYANNRWWENAALIDLIGYKNVIKANQKNNIISKIINRFRVLRNTQEFLKNKLLSKQKNNIKIDLNNKFLKKIGWLDLKWNSISNVCESENPVINHYAGRSYKERLEHMERDFENLR